MKWNRVEGSLEIPQLRAAYAEGLTPSEVVEAIYARMENSPHENVWSYLAPKEKVLARATALGASHPELPLFGIPFAVKDNIDVAGMPTGAACPDFAYVPATSAPCVIALERAGAICIGKTNMDQFATGLVGTRSPYGACRNVFRPEYLSGGSSSGSAVAVSAGFVAFSLGTDTAGSGRVPAALNNVVGVKPTRGLVSTQGVVPACRSLDCVSVFSLSVQDGALARDLMAGATPSLAGSDTLGLGFRFGVPSALEWFGDAYSEALFARSLDLLESLGGRAVPFDFESFRNLGDLLYGPWVVERYLAVGRFIEAHPDAVLGVTRDIILGAKRVTSADVFRGLELLEQLRAECKSIMKAFEVMVVPTVPRHFLRTEDAEEPRAINDRLGIYTRFANFLSAPVLSVPAGFRQDGLPFGVSLVAGEGADHKLDRLGGALHALSGAGMGLKRTPAPAHVLGESGPPVEARLAVVGAHMRGLALHDELLACGARFVRTARTEPHYRMYLVPDSQPLKPGLVRVTGPGYAVEVELFDLPWAGLGKLMERVRAPLSIGNIRTEYGEWVKGFLCEPCALDGAPDVSAYGGFRAYLEEAGSGAPAGKAPDLG